MKNRKDLENDYIGHEELLAKHKHDLEHKREEQRAFKEKEKVLHHMKCSKCGEVLRTVRMSYIDVDQCTSCGAIVLAKDDIEKFVTEQGSILKTLIDFFKS